MRNILYVVGVVLIIFWAIGFLVYSVGAIIHLLLLLAIMVFLIKVIPKNKGTMKQDHSNLKSQNNETVVTP